MREQSINAITSELKKLLRKDNLLYDFELYVNTTFDQSIRRLIAEEFENCEKEGQEYRCMKMKHYVFDGRFKKTMQKWEQNFPIIFKKQQHETNKR